MTIWLGDTWVEVLILDWDEIGPVFEVVDSEGPFDEGDVADAIPEEARPSRVTVLGW